MRAAREIVEDFSRHFYEARSYAKVSWRGVQTIAYPTDLIVYAELIWKIRPDVIVECLPGTATVRMPSRAGVAATRRSYDGLIIEVFTAAGRHLTATPNHPVLTRTGWKAIQLVQQGDEVVCDGLNQRMRGRFPDIDDVPTPIGQVFDALQRGPIQRRSLVPMDFHVDAPKGQVEIVGRHGLLGLNGDPSRRQPFRHFSFAGSYLGLPPLARRGDSQIFVDGPSSAACSNMHPFHPINERFGPGLSPVAHGLGVASRHDGMTRFTHGLGYAPPGYAQIVGDGGGPVSTQIALNGLGLVERRWPASQSASAEIRNDPSARDSVVFGDRPRGLPGEVTLDRVVGVERRMWSGQVFNLSTEEGWYSAEGIIVHNCGTFQGGRALYMADLLDAIGHGVVVTIDVKDWSGPDGYPQHPRIEYLRGSSVEPGVVRQVADMIGTSSAFVILDSNHSAAHVLAELEAYGPLVSRGSYVVVEDTNVHQVMDGYGPGPDDAVAKWLPEHPEFVICRESERFMVTAAPGGWLRRV